MLEIRARSCLHVRARCIGAHGFFQQFSHLGQLMISPHRRNQLFNTFDYLC